MSNSKQRENITFIGTNKCQKGMKSALSLKKNSISTKGKDLLSLDTFENAMKNL